MRSMHPTLSDTGLTALWIIKLVSREGLLGVADFVCLSHPRTADGTLHLKPPTTANRDELRGSAREHLVDCSRVLEDDKPEAAVLTLRPCTRLGHAPCLLQPGSPHLPILRENCMELILTHILRDAAHENLLLLGRHGPSTRPVNVS